MNTKELLTKNNIGETLLITLYLKAKESKHSNPIITDVKACELVEKLDYNFSKFDKAVNSSIGVVLRSRYFDEKLKAFIERSKQPVVVLLGTGLDSRYERIGDIAQKATFYQLDIPEVIQIREQWLPPHQNETLVATSMFETAWMDDLATKHSGANFLFIVEGVLMYFEREIIKKWFQDMAERFSQSELLFDIINVWMSNNSHIHDTVKLMNAKFVWGTDDDKEIESWASNLEYISARLYADFPEWERVGWLKALLMKLIPSLKYSGRMLHYKIN